MHALVRRLLTGIALLAALHSALAGVLPVALRRGVEATIWRCEPRGPETVKAGFKEIHNPLVRDQLYTDPGRPGAFDGNPDTPGIFSALNADAALTRMVIAKLLFRYDERDSVILILNKYTPPTVLHTVRYLERLPPEAGVHDAITGERVILGAQITLPPLRFDCGLDDPFLPAKLAQHRPRVEAGIGQEYAELPVGHDWSYWSLHFEDTLRLFAKTLKGMP